MKSITIVGGGLAGLTLGILLRRLNVPVTVWEAGCYPRHKVCGEFVSGEGVSVLKRLGLWDRIRSLGTPEISSVRFLFGDDKAFSLTLPSSGFGVSRYSLDHLLAREFQATGGDWVERRWKEGFTAAGVVRATGRRMEPRQGSWRWFGLKGHARLLKLEADLEMHFGSNAYVGLSAIETGEINVCGLFRKREAARGLRDHWIDWLGDGAGAALRDRIHAAEFVPESFCSVAGLPVNVAALADGGEFAIGDSAAMIPPVTGNGMSIAIESADLAAEPLEGYSSGTCDWDLAVTEVRRRFERRFGRRLWVAGLLQRGLFCPPCLRLLRWVGPSRFVSALYRSTR